MQVPIKAILESSPEYFAQEIFGLRMSECHRDMMNHIEGDGDRLLLCQRGIGKSVLLQSYITYLLIKDPNIRIILVSSTDTKARSFLRSIKQTLESKKVTEIWGDCRGSTWSDRELIMSGRTDIHAEASLTAVGAGSGSVTGLHADLVILDDLVDFDSTRSELKRNRIVEWFKTSLKPCLLSNGHFIAAGTRYHFADVYKAFIDNLGFNTLILPPIKNGKAQCEFLQPIEDVVKNGIVQVRGLKTIKQHLGSVIYALQYENDVALLMEGNIISHDWIKYYDRLPTGLGEIIISCDPAISKNAGSDNTSIIVSGRHNGNIYIIKEITGHFSFKETLDHIESLATKYNPDEIRIEQVGFSEAFITETKARVPNIFIHGIKPLGDKESRLRSVSPMLENGIVYFSNKHGNIIDELLLFPDGDHDDRVDAIQIALSFYKNAAGECLVF